MSIIQAPDLTVITAEQVTQHLGMKQAITALENAVRSGLEPDKSLPRSSVPLQQGSFLLMPGEYDGYAGVKVVTVAPANPGRGLPKIQGNYLLFDSDTLRPLVLIDGAALTAIRTPAISALAIDHLVPTRASTLVVFGTGPQALYHVRAVAAVRTLNQVMVVGRSDEKTEALVRQLQAEGYNARPGAAADVAGADIVACCTSARDPLFDGSTVRDDAVVVAMGSHEPDAREVDDVLLSRSTVYVEDVDTALREAGDVIIGIHNGALRPEDLHGLSALVRNGARHGTGPAFFKSVGMGWQDLITARVVYEELVAGTGEPRP